MASLSDESISVPNQPEYNDLETRATGSSEVLGLSIGMNKAMTRYAPTKTIRTSRSQASVHNDNEPVWQRGALVRRKDERAFAR